MYHCSLGITRVPEPLWPGLQQPSAPYPDPPSQDCPAACWPWRPRAQQLTTCQVPQGPKVFLGRRHKHTHPGHILGCRLPSPACSSSLSSLWVPAPTCPHFRFPGPHARQYTRPRPLWDSIPRTQAPSPPSAGQAELCPQDLSNLTCDSSACQGQCSQQGQTYLPTPAQATPVSSTPCGVP